MRGFLGKFSESICIMWKHKRPRFDPGISGVHPSWGGRGRQPTVQWVPRSGESHGQSCWGHSPGLKNWTWLGLNWALLVIIYYLIFKNGICPQVLMQVRKYNLQLGLLSERMFQNHGLQRLWLFTYYISTL